MEELFNIEKVLGFCEKICYFFLVNLLFIISNISILMFLLFVGAGQIRECLPLFLLCLLPAGGSVYDEPADRRQGRERTAGLSERILYRFPAEGRSWRRAVVCDSVMPDECGVFHGAVRDFAAGNSVCHLVSGGGSRDAEPLYACKPLQDGEYADCKNRSYPSDCKAGILPGKSGGASARTWSIRDFGRHYGAVYGKRLRISCDVYESECA